MKRGDPSLAEDLLHRGEARAGVALSATPTPAGIAAFADAVAKADPTVSALAGELRMLALEATASD